MVKKSTKIQPIYDNNHILSINFSNRNLFLTYASKINGNVIIKRSVGIDKFKNSKKRNIFAFTTCTRNFTKALTDGKVNSVENVNIKGYNKAVVTLLKTIQQKIQIFNLTDITPLMHGGCKQSRPKRK